MKSATITALGLITLVGMGIYAYNRIKSDTAYNPDKSNPQILANPIQTKTGSITVSSKEESVFNTPTENKIILRTPTSDGGMTSYKIDPAELSAYQRFLLKHNWYKITPDGTFKQDLPFVIGA